jgi:hypothetical protein
LFQPELLEVEREPAVVFHRGEDRLVATHKVEEKVLVQDAFLKVVVFLERLVKIFREGFRFRRLDGSVQERSAGLGRRHKVGMMSANSPSRNHCKAVLSSDSRKASIAR